MEALACPAGTRCHETIERLGRQKLTIQRGKGKTIQNLRQALHRKEMACELKDTEVKKQKMLSVGKDATCKAKLDALNQRLTTKHNKEIEGLKLNLLKLRETQKLVQANTKQTHRVQAQEIKRLQSVLSRRLSRYPCRCCSASVVERQNRK